MKPSERAVSRTPVPLSSIARRAARMRSTASVKSNKRVRVIAGRIFDRQPGDAGRRRRRHVARHVGRLDREAALEVGVDRHVHGLRDRAQVARALRSSDTLVVAAPDATTPTRSWSSRAPETRAARARGRCRRPTGWA